LAHNEPKDYPQSIFRVLIKHPFFLENCSKNWSNCQRAAFTVSIGLPLFITLYYPGLFLMALNVAGSVGTGMVFGILPGIILIKMRKAFKPNVEH